MGPRGFCLNLSGNCLSGPQALEDLEGAEQLSQSLSGEPSQRTHTPVDEVSKQLRTRNDFEVIRIERHPRCPP